MAHIASINGSTAISPPSSQVATSAPDTAEHEFLALLSQVSAKPDQLGLQDAGKLSTSHSARSVVTQASDILSDKLGQKIRLLLDKGISLDKITHAIASKLVEASGGRNDVDKQAKISAVANYLKQGEQSSQDNETTSKSIVAKVKTLLANAKPTADKPTGPEFGNILDAETAGETPTLDKPNLQATPAETQAVSDDALKPTKPEADVKTEAKAELATSSAADAALLAAAVQALQAQPPASSTQAKPAPTPTAPAGPDLVQTDVAPSPQTQQTQTNQTQDAALASASDRVAQAKAAADVALAIQTQAAPPAAASDPNQALSLGQLAQQSLLHVDSELHAIASGQGTELGRALIRAANVDIARSSKLLDAGGDTMLASLTASLDDLLTATQPQTADDGNTPQQQQQNPNTALGGFAAGLTAGNVNTATQTGFSGQLSRSASPQHAEEVMEQVVHGLSIKDFASNPTVKIVLNPQHLGELDVKLTVTDSVVHATVIAQSHEVRDIMLANKTQLDQVLAQAGLKLGSLTVDVDGKSTQQDAERRQTQRDQIFAARNQNTQSEPEAEDVPSIGPSMLGSVNLRLLNHLA